MPGVHRHCRTSGLVPILLTWISRPLLELVAASEDEPPPPGLEVGCHSASLVLMASWACSFGKSTTCLCCKISDETQHNEKAVLSFNQWKNDGQPEPHACTLSRSSTLTKMDLLSVQLKALKEDLRCAFMISLEDRVRKFYLGRGKLSDRRG